MKTIASFRTHGLHVHREDAYTLKTDTGAHFALNNLLIRCLDAGRSNWDSVIDTHVAAMVEATRDSDPALIAAIPDVEFYSRLRERVIAPTALTAVGEHTYAVPLLDAPGSPLRVLNLSFPSRALTLGDHLLAGRDVETAWAAGRANTAAINFDTSESLLKDGIEVEVLRGDSIYLASKVADMTTLISTQLGECLYGIMFIVPSAYEIDFYRVHDPDDALAAAELMIELAEMLCRTTPSGLSRSVFFWRDGEYSQVSDGYTVEPTGIFASTLMELRARAA